MPLSIAYLINQYPMVSHSFVRREINALERQEVKVRRVAVRGWDSALADPQDVQERAQTEYLLRRGVTSLLIPFLTALVTAPVRMVQTCRLMAKCARESDKSLPHHAVYLAEACLLLSWLKRWQVRHVHAHFGTNSAQVAMLACALGGSEFSYSFTAHGPEEFDKPLSLSLGEKIRRASFVAAISSFGRSQLFRWVDRTHWHKIQVVHCGLEKAFHAGEFQAPAALNKTLVCIGRLCEQKGQLLLVDAANILRQRGVEFKLVLAGDGEMRADIEAAISRYELQDRIRITGWISSTEVRNELLAARALVLPSFAEGLPVVIMEAMSLRRPVLSTFVAGIPELVQAGGSGWLFPAGDVEQLANAMQDCLQTPEEALTAMGDAARHRVLMRHDIEDSAAQLKALFAGVAKPA